jgi:transposase
MILLLNRGVGMAGFIEGVDRGQLSLLPESLDQWVEESNPVRVIDAFVEQLDLDELGFKMAAPAELGRPGYNPALHLKLYIYGYLHRIQSSRRLERECQRNLEVMWLLGRLTPDHKTIADFRKENGAAIKKVCARFVELWRQMGPTGEGERCDRRLEVQSRQQPGQELHHGEGRETAQAIGGERGALSLPARHRGSA